MDYISRYSIFSDSYSKLCIGAGITIVFLLFLLSAYSPIVSLYLSLIILCSSIRYNSALRFSISINIIFTIAVVCASRSIYMARNDDFLGVYLPLFQYISHGGGMFYSDFSGGVEFFLPLLFKILFLVGVSGKVGIIFSFVFIVLFLFYIWIELFLKNIYKVTDKTIVIASILGFVFFAVLSQQMRQVLSTVFILYFLYYYLMKKKVLSFSWLLLAAVTHLSAIPVSILLIAMVSKKPYKYVLTVILFLFTWLFAGVLTFLISSNYLGVAAYKLNYYLYNKDMSFSSYLYYCPIFIMYCFFYKIKNNVSSEIIKNLMLFSSLFYLILLPIPLASDRVLMFSVLFLKGLYIYFVFQNYLSLYRIALIMFFCFKIITIWNVVPSVENGISSFWGDYPPAGDTMFYYFD